MAQKRRRVNSRTVTLSSEKSKIKACGNYVGGTTNDAEDEDESTIRSCSLVNRHRARIPWLLFQRHFRFTIVLSRIYRNELRGADTRSGCVLVRGRTSSLHRGRALYPDDKKYEKFSSCCCRRETKVLQNFY